MKIVKFKKDRTSKYKIYLDDDNILLLYDDVIIKYNLLVKKDLSSELLKEIIKYNDFIESYYKSIKYINKKMRTELEVRKFLKKEELDETNIDEIIKRLYKDGYLNKINYICAYINDQYNLTNNGPLKVNKSLISLGYKEEDIIEYINNYEWDSRIEKIILKKIKTNHKLSNNNLKIKINHDLINLGYSKDSINEVINNVTFKDDYDILSNELRKVKNKYKLKYSEEKLEYKVINYFLKLGFDLSDIKRCYNEN